YPPHTAGMTAKSGVSLTLCMTLLGGPATTREAQKKHVGHATRSNPTHYLPVSSVIRDLLRGTKVYSGSKAGGVIKS
ncbi:MAG: hypothetical protein VST68_00005, partial [Nitrospirota bacterium]|nr:hypothetical protein [Nitrospirota bacterium]